MAIQKLGELAKESFKELGKIQKGEKLLVKTGFEFIDDHLGGLLPGDCIVLSGLSGHGKSETLFRLRENILNEAVNKDASNYVWLNYNLEVKIFNVVLRGLNRKLGKKKQAILFEDFTEEEKLKAKEYYEALTDNRQYVEQESLTADQFYEQTKTFLQEHEDKEACHISFDHAALIGDSETTKGIEKLVLAINKLKLEFNNAYFYIVSQLNRNILNRINDKDNKAAPNAGDLYASSSMDFISSYNIVVFDAHKVGIEQFLKVNPDRYDYLYDHFGDEDSKGRRSFNTVGKLFYKVIKTRESDSPWKDWYVIEKDIPKDDLDKYSELIDGDISFSNITPTFNNPDFDEDDPF